MRYGNKAFKDWYIKATEYTSTNKLISIRHVPGWADPWSTIESKTIAVPVHRLIIRVQRAYRLRDRPRVVFHVFLLVLVPFGTLPLELAGATGEASLLQVREHDPESANQVHAGACRQSWRMGFGRLCVSALPARGIVVVGQWGARLAIMHTQGKQCVNKKSSVI